MKKFAIVKNGLVKQTILCLQIEADKYAELGSVIECSDEVTINHYYKNGEFYKLPENDLGVGDFDIDSESWVVDSEIELNVLLSKLRAERNRLLSATDWTQVADAPVDKEAWKTYRQALRDLPSQYDTLTDINQVVWPTAPNEV